MAHENSLKNQKARAEAANAVDKQLFPDTTFKKGKFSQKVGKEKVTMHYFGAAHTDGDSFVHFENANIVHCGDLVFNNAEPAGAGRHLPAAGSPARPLSDAGGHTLSRDRGRTAHPSGNNGRG